MNEMGKHASYFLGMFQGFQSCLYFCSSIKNLLTYIFLIIYIYIYIYGLSILIRCNLIWNLYETYVETYT